ncbi:Soul heme-binding family protein [Thalictrum thalictroides]|uniref:Soul heme-binding family protein n=1 Tax=Thalictrum thalictroides TaxID=46969 RepID=A0A7J6WSE6_THATH|nr:Soul heme-binding family protein [Thalictrum thalictroides]
MKKNLQFSIFSICFFIVFIFCNGIESPQYTVIHTESDFEIRLYRESAWMSAPVRDISFEKATKLGFHRLFQYIQGANLNNSRISMTTPVLTSIVSAGPFQSSAYNVRFYLPVKFQGIPPLPLPELDLRPVASGSHCVAVRKFSGFARDKNIVAEAEKLSVSLTRSPWANSTAKGTYGYSIAQYNSPFRFIRRVNEVWVNLDGSKVEGCQSDVATF